MKNALLFFLLLTMFCSCKKETITQIQAPGMTLKDVVSKVSKVYTTTAICTQGSGVSGYVTDTSYNVALIVAGFQDTVLYTLGKELYFAGNLDTKYYYFYSPSSGGGYHAFFDSTFTFARVSTWDGGLGGGSGCTYTGQ
jgi:hypothetical protein